ncbi:MAG: hypothetical protein MJE77_43280 [Proteobacteria bacterium]|nr:hypothetical protein [Pseudomonadota bacterium]
MMTQRYGLIAVFMSLAFVLSMACQGEFEYVDPDPGMGNGMTNGTPQEFFTANVATGLKNECGNCHKGDAPIGPAFMGNAAADTYTAVLAATPSAQNAGKSIVAKGNPQGSILLTYGVHQPGPALSANLMTQVQTWIEMETP